jgi:hypothetical protein
MYFANSCRGFPGSEFNLAEVCMEKKMIYWQRMEVCATFLIARTLFTAEFLS